MEGYEKQLEKLQVEMEMLGKQIAPGNGECHNSHYILPF